MRLQSAIPAKQATRSARILELDALRGLAAVAVVLFHYTTRYEQLFGHEGSLVATVPWGDFGVDLFFMLSGFVILMTLERNSDGWKFTWGRFSRLYPTYWVAAAVTFLVVTLCGLPGQEVTLGEALVNLTMVQALLGRPHIDGAYWSLQAELIFYANMLLLFRLGTFKRPAVTVLGWLAVAVGVQLLQAYPPTALRFLASILSKLATIGSLKFIPLFGIGILLYDRQRATKAQHATELPKLNSLGLLGCLLTLGYWEGLPALAIDAALASLLWLAIRGQLPLLAARPLVWLGAISYSLYLIHQNIGYVLIRNLEAQGVTPTIAIAIACALSLCLAACLHYGIERPTMQRFRRIDLSLWFRRRAATSANS